MIEIAERFEVPASPARVWEVLSDPHAVVECVPGASIERTNEDGSFDAKLTVKFGPTRISFMTQCALDLDSAAHTGKLSARGKENAAGTRIASAATFAVAPQGDGTEVSVQSTVEVAGRLAGMIEGGAGVVARRMSAEFAKRLAERCTQEAARP